MKQRPVIGKKEGAYLSGIIVPARSQGMMGMDEEYGNDVQSI